MRTKSQLRYHRLLDVANCRKIRITLKMAWVRSEVGLFVRFKSPSELPLALPLPPSEASFTHVVQKNVVPVRYVSTVFPANVSERMQLVSLVVVHQKFNRKPLGVVAFAQGARTFERS